MFTMRGWKWVMFMWSSIAGIIFFKVAQVYPVATAKWFVTPGNASLLSLLISLPLMIWLIKFMRGMMGSSKDPKKWWKDDDKGQF